MRIGKFFLNSEKEVVVKIVYDVLRLFKIDIIEDIETIDYRSMRVENEIAKGEQILVTTKVVLECLNGTKKLFTKAHSARPYEREKAAIHRLIKLNFYQILCEEFKFYKMPWGIMYGVRPTKLIHRFLRQNIDTSTIREHLIKDYEVTREKANLLLDVSLYQNQFLAEKSKNTISIYIGIPFCASKCLYCSFPSYKLQVKEQLEKFMSIFFYDFMQAKELVKIHNLKVESIYIGGGTPTALPEEAFETLLAITEKAFFSIATKEFTVEAGRVDTITQRKILSMCEHKVTRVSVNPQTMQQKTLDLIERKHLVADIYKIYKLLQATNKFSINMDLILGLPSEMALDVDESVKKVLDLAPASITLHALALKKGSKLKLNLDNYQLPDDKEVQKMYKIATNLLLKSGYIPYYLYRQGYQSGGLDNIGYAKPGKECLYNIKMIEEEQNILGIGTFSTTKTVFNKEGRIKSVFYPKELSIYLRDIEHYVAQRKNLFNEVYSSK